MLGWHFVSRDERERFGKRRVIRPGRTYKVKGPITLCKWGLHASERAIDALRYAPEDGWIVCRVRLSGTILYDTDKAVATERTVLAMADAEAVIHKWHTDAHAYGDTDGYTYAV